MQATLKALMPIPLLLLLIAVPASAQRTDKSGVPYRVWDVHAAPDILWLAYAEAADTESGRDLEDWDVRWVGTVDVGRYWNSHVKTEVGILTGAHTRWYGHELVTAVTGESVTAGLYGDTRQTQVSVALTYQFLENVFAHPYVSAGGRLAVRNIRVERAANVWRYRNGEYVVLDVPPYERQTTDVRVRPFVAFGTKSYFNERLFVRPELMLVFSPNGLCQAGLRLGFGVDF